MVMTPISLASCYRKELEEVKREAAASWKGAGSGAGGGPATSAWLASWRWRTRACPSCRRCSCRPEPWGSGKHLINWITQYNEKCQSKNWVIKQNPQNPNLNRNAIHTNNKVAKEALKGKGVYYRPTWGFIWYCLMTVWGGGAGGLKWLNTLVPYLGQNRGR